MQMQSRTIQGERQDERPITEHRSITDGDPKRRTIGDVEIFRPRRPYGLG